MLNVQTYLWFALKLSFKSLNRLTCFNGTKERISPFLFVPKEFEMTKEHEKDTPPAPHTSISDVVSKTID